MDTKYSMINREIGRQIKMHQSVTLSVRELAERTGISDATINRMWSKDPRDINITQLTWLAALMGTTPQKLIEKALEEVGGLGAVMDELHKSLAMSEASGMKDDLETRRLQKEAEKMSPAEIEEIAIAATKDPERRTDEPPTV